MTTSWAEQFARIDFVLFNGRRQSRAELSISNSMTISLIHTKRATWLATLISRLESTNSKASSTRNEQTEVMRHNRVCGYVCGRIQMVEPFAPSPRAKRLKAFLAFLPSVVGFAAFAGFGFANL